MSDCGKVDNILKNQPHYIDGKQVECKIAIPKDYIGPIATELPLPQEQPSNAGLFINKKIFVGGLHPALREHDMRYYFEQFGEVEQCVIMHDKPTGKSRGFGFVIFVKESAADLVMQYKNKHNLMGKWVDCKRAMPKEVLMKEPGGSFNGKVDSKYNAKDTACDTNNGMMVNMYNMQNAFTSSSSPSSTNNSYNSKSAQPVNQNYVVNNYCKQNNINHSFVDINQSAMGLQKSNNASNASNNSLGSSGANLGNNLTNLNNLTSLTNLTNLIKLPISE
jgi:RNA recognition motif-containing protein